MKPTSDIDYTSLAQPVIASEIAAYNKISNNTQSKKKHQLISTIVVVGAVIVFLVLYSVGHFNTTSLPIIVLLWLTAGGIGYAIYVTGKLRKISLVKMDRFARKNNFSMIHDIQNPGYTGMIFDEGHSRKLSEAYILTDKTQIANYQYTTGSGKNSQTHAYGYIAITLSRRLPHMVLDGKANNHFKYFTGLPESFSRSQVLSLEGDFDNYFTLYAPQEYKRDALYVFTPDVMAKLIDECKGYDLEIVEDKLFIYKNEAFDLLQESQLKSLIEVVRTIGGEVRSQTEHYSDSMVKNSRTTNVIGKDGRRLKRSHLLLISIITVVILFYLLSYSNVLISLLT